MVRPKDPFWNYAEEEPKGFKCKFCGRVFPGGAPRIKSHLSGLKCRGIDICTKVLKNVQAAALFALGRGSSNKFKIATASSDLEIMSSSTKCLAKHSDHNSLLNMWEKDMSMVHKELAKFIISNNIACDAVESQSFVDFVKGVAGCGLTYKLPSSMILKTEFVPNVEKEVEEYVKDLKKSWATTGCTIMFHVGWKSVDLYAYCQKGAIFLNLYKISRKGSMNVDFKNIVASVIEDIGVEYVVQFITNNALAFRSVGELLDSNFPNIYKVQCVADMLHLLLKDIYEKVGWVKSVIDHAKLIVDNVYSDDSIYSLMKQYTNGRELKHPCVSKFASNYQMLQTVLQNEKGLQQLVASVKCGSLDRTAKVAEVASIITDAGFWREGQEVFKALEPLIQVLCLVEGEGGTSGYLYAAMKKAKEAIVEYCSDDNYKCNEAKMILELFEERRKYIVHPVHSAAAFLNPSYMCHENYEEDCNMKNGISFMIEKMVAEKERQKFAWEVQLYRGKVPGLFTVMAKEMLETCHPCIWWEYCGDSLPVLQKYALRILSQPCKCLWEHEFGPSEVAQTKKIDGAELLQTKMNMKLMEKFITLQANLMRPMNLDKVCKLPDYDDPDPDWTGDGNQLSIKSSVPAEFNEAEHMQPVNKDANTVQISEEKNVSYVQPMQHRNEDANTVQINEEKNISYVQSMQHRNELEASRWTINPIELVSPQEVGQKRLQEEVGVAQSESTGTLVYGEFGEIRSSQEELSSSAAIVAEEASSIPPPSATATTSIAMTKTNINEAFLEEEELSMSMSRVSSISFLDFDRDSADASSFLDFDRQDSADASSFLDFDRQDSADASSFLGLDPLDRAEKSSLHNWVDLYGLDQPSLDNAKASSLRSWLDDTTFWSFKN